MHSLDIGRPMSAQDWKILFAPQCGGGISSAACEHVARQTGNEKLKREMGTTTSMIRSEPLITWSTSDNRFSGEPIVPCSVCWQCLENWREPRHKFIIFNHLVCLHEFFRSLSQALSLYFVLHSSTLQTVIQYRALWCIRHASRRAVRRDFIIIVPCLVCWQCLENWRKPRHKFIIFNHLVCLHEFFCSLRWALSLYFVLHSSTLQIVIQYRALWCIRHALRRAVRRDFIIILAYFWTLDIDKNRHARNLVDARHSITVNRKALLPTRSTTSNN